MKFYECDCGGEALVVDKWDDVEAYVFSIWRLGTTRWSWKARIGHIWHIIKNGHPWLDEVVLSKGELSTLAADLMEYAVKDLEKFIDLGVEKL